MSAARAPSSADAFLSYPARTALVADALTDQLAWVETVRGAANVWRASLAEDWAPSRLTAFGDDGDPVEISQLQFAQQRGGRSAVMFNERWHLQFRLGAALLDGHGRQVLRHGRAAAVRRGVARAAHRADAAPRRARLARTRLCAHGRRMGIVARLARGGDAIAAAAHPWRRRRGGALRRDRRLRAPTARARRRAGGASDQ